MRILCDMDGVVADFCTTVLDRYNKKYDDNLKVEDITSYGMHLVVKPECGLDIYNIYAEEGIFANCALIPGAKEVLGYCLGRGHEVVFVTKAVDFSQYCFPEKQKWVNAHFPEIGHEKMVFTGQKHLVRGDVLIDDHTNNLEKFEGRRILVDAPWNQGFDHRAHNMMRLKSWPEILGYIKVLDTI